MSVHIVALFVAYLVPILEFTTICSYVARIILYQTFHNLAAPDQTHCTIRTALVGVWHSRLKLSHRRRQILSTNVLSIHEVLPQIKKKHRTVLLRLVLSVFTPYYEVPTCSRMVEKVKLIREFAMLAELLTASY